MRSPRHWFALALLGALGLLVMASSRKPSQKMDAGLSLPPLERKHTAVAAAYVVSASDVCVRANSSDASALDAESFKALRDACTRAAQEQARALNWDEGEWVVEDPAADTAAPSRRSLAGPGKVARRAATGGVEEPKGGRER